MYQCFRDRDETVTCAVPNESHMSPNCWASTCHYKACSALNEHNNILEAFIVVQWISNYSFSFAQWLVTSRILHTDLIELSYASH